MIEGVDACICIHTLCACKSYSRKTVAFQVMRTERTNQHNTFTVFKGTEGVILRAMREEEAKIKKQQKRM